MNSLDVPGSPVRAHPNIQQYSRWFCMTGRGGWAEFDVDFRVATSAVAMTLSMQLNALSSRMLQLLARASSSAPWTVVANVAGNTTGSWWQVSDMQWFPQGTFVVPCTNGQTTLRLQTAGYFPHLGVMRLSWPSASAVPAAPAATAARSVYSQHKGAIVSIYVRSPGWVGSGFVYHHNSSYYIVTAAHVVMGVNRNNVAVGPIYAAVPTQTGVVSVTCSVVGVAGTSDVGVLRLVSPAVLPQHSLAFARQCPLPGSSCFVLGDPLGMDSISIAEGIVRDSQYIYNNAIPCSIIQSVAITCPVYGGNSGSGIVDAAGDVIGLVSYGTGQVFSWGVASPHLETIVHAILATGGNFVGKTLDATMVLVDLWVRAAYGLPSTAMQGIYVVNSSTPGLLSGDIITTIQGQAVGLYHQYGHVTPMALYMHGASIDVVVQRGGSTLTLSNVPLIQVSLAKDTPLFANGNASGTRHLQLQRDAS